jgi:hypothetical protein
MQELEVLGTQMLEKAKAVGDRIGAWVEVNGLNVRISHEVVTNCDTFSKALNEHPGLLSSVDTLYTALLSGNGSASGPVDFGGGSFTLTSSDSLLVPFRNDMGRKKGAISASCGGLASREERAAGRVIYPMLDKLLTESDIIVGARSEKGYEFEIPVSNELSESGQMATDTTIVDSIIFIMQRKGVHNYTIRKVDTPLQIGKSEPGFSIEEIDPAFTAKRAGFIIAPEKQQNGHLHADILTIVKSGSQSGSMVVADAEIRKDSDAFEMGFALGPGNAHLNRPILEVPSSGNSAKVWSIFEVEKQGELYDCLVPVYAKGERGRLGTTDTIGALRRGETDSIFTGQVEALNQGPYKKVNFEGSILDLAPLQRQLRDVQIRVTKETAKIKA